MSPPDLRKQLVKITTSAPDDWTSRIVAAASGNGPASDTSDDDPANAGIRREPELPEHEEITPPERPAIGEFALLDDEPDVDAAKARSLRHQVTSVARQAAMDPADGIEL